MNLYKEPEEWKPNLNIKNVNVISEEEQSWLKRPNYKDYVL